MENKEKVTMEETARVEKTLTFKSGQTGVSYQSLFAEYVADATELIIQDPYVATSVQIENLYEFLDMLVHVCKKPNVKVLLKTKDIVAEHDNLVDVLDEVKVQCETVGLDFAYELFKECPHQRSIDTDNGWSIYLDRGLSIFDDSYINHPFARLNQELRPLRDFTVDYVQR